jgi:glycosyltransferase involved in cell wall biosynthesis
MELITNDYYGAKAARAMTCLTYFEPLEEGHCTLWAQLILRAAAEDGRVTQLRLVTSANLARRLEAVVKATGLELKILSETQLALLRQNQLSARGLAQWAAARSCLDDSKGQLFLPFFDHAAFGAALDRRGVAGHISGVIFRPPNAFNQAASLRRRLDSARRWVSYLTARRKAVRRLFTLDEMAPKAAVSRAAGLLTFLPDPAPDLSLLQGRSSQLRTDGRKVFLLFGSLGQRKGIFAIIESLSQLPAARRAAMALRFVGRVLPQDRETFLARLEAARSTYSEMAIEWLDNFVSEETLAQEVIDCDVVLAPYQNHVGSSGVMFWAAAAGKPLIGQRTGLMGYQLERYNLGFATDTTDPRALAGALTRALDGAGHRPSNKAFLRAHSPAAFTGTILDGLLS